MKLEQSFNVKAPIEQVWDALVDVERVAPCLPGAEITGQAPDGGYEGTFTVKLGPATASYRGSLKMESLDEAGRVATMTAKGTDKRGQGGANASIVSTMREEGDETVVEVMTDFTITGRLARFGRGGMIEDISKRLMRDFAQCLQDTLAHEPAPAATAPEPEQAAVASATAAAPTEPLGAAQAGAPTEPPAAEPAAAPVEPALPGEEPAGAPQPAVTAEPPSPAPGLAAEPGPLPGDDAPADRAPADGAPADGPPSDAGEAARPPGEADPWAPLSPPADAPVEPEAAQAPPRTTSIPPPSAAARPAPQQAKAKPVQGFSLLLSVFWERIKRFVAGLASRGRKR
jgi:carbon monoxide dehydrogenase subunit G